MSRFDTWFKDVTAGNKSSTLFRFVGSMNLGMLKGTKIVIEI